MRKISKEISNFQIEKEISNFQIEEIFRDIDDADINNNFVGVFPSNHMNRFIDYKSMKPDKDKYPFIIVNTDSSDKNGMHWWINLDTEPKTDLFFLYVWC